jgi:hypothetical protein
MAQYQENGLTWSLRHPEAQAYLGFIPSFIHAQDERSAREQLHANYAHGGGWSPLSGWQLPADWLPADWVPGPMPPSIAYPGDPALIPVIWTKLRDESIAIYPHAWVMVMQPGGAFEVARMD